MAKQLTDSEYQARLDAIDKFIDENNTVNMNTGQRQVFSAGFVAGLSCNQAKLDKLISYIKGEIPRSEIEGIIE